MKALHKCHITSRLTNWWLSGVTFTTASTVQNAISWVIQMQASAVEDEFCLLWFAYLDTRVLCVGMGVCAGSRFKCHGTDRTLVKDFTVTTLNMRLECRHVRVHNIAVHAAAERAEESQCSPAPSSAGHNQQGFSSKGKRETHTANNWIKPHYSVNLNNPVRINRIAICGSQSKRKEIYTFSFENLLRSERFYVITIKRIEGSTDKYSIDCRKNA